MYNVTVANTTFKGNWCGGWGGGFWAVASGSATVTLEEVMFSNNSVSSRFDGDARSFQGGAYFASGSGMTTTVRECVFDSNVASYDGGAVALEGGYFAATQAMFLDNSASWDSGGAIVASAEEYWPTVVSLRSVLVKGNTASEQGGGILVEAGADMELEDVHMNGNVARAGGAMSVAGGAQALCHDSNFTGNSAEVRVMLSCKCASTSLSSLMTIDCSSGGESSRIQVGKDRDWL